MQEMQETQVQSLGQGRFLRVGNDTLLHYFCLEESMGREAWWAIVHGAAKSWTQLYY